MLGLVLSGTIAPSKSDAESQRKLKISGVPAVATVIEANPEARFLRYYVDFSDRIGYDPLVKSMEDEDEEE